MMTDMHQTDVSGDGQPPTLAIAGVTKTRCPECGREDHWHDDAFLIPKVCARCGADLVITAATHLAHTAAEAIARAAQELPERVEPKQQPLPGVRPMFDVQAAWRSIMDKRAALRDAEFKTADRAEAHKYAKKREETIRGELDTMLDQFAQRQAEWYQKSDGHAQESEGNNS